MTTPSTPAVVLCVDDEPILLQVRGLVLRQAGFEPVLASRADEALAIFRTRSVDLVITDHLLPGRSGSELAADIKQIKPDVPILMMSGVMEASENLQSIDAFIMKGVPVPEFLSLVESMLSRKG